MSPEKRIDDLISIVVPVYKAESFIAKTIEQVMAQTYQNFELILVDDASPDKSADIIKRAAKKDSRIRLLQKNVNEGAAAARNSGIDCARGRYLAFLDADDYWYPKKLSRQLEFIKENGAGFTFTSYEFGDEDAMPTGKVVRAPKELDFRKALSRTVIFTSTVMIDLDKVPAELAHMPSIASEDTATWWSILKAGYTAGGLDEVLVIYRRPKKSLSSNKLKAIKRIWGLYRKIAKLSVIESAFYFVSWGVRASLRRL